MNSKKITIDLLTSTSAHGFESGFQLHEAELNDCIELIRNQIHKASSFYTNEDDCVVLTHDYETIGIFGDRGSGKTSFMMSLLQECKRSVKEAEVLRLIDPTLVEHKKPIVLCVLAMINQLVEKRMRQFECSSTVKTAYDRSAWEAIMNDIATGIVAIENVGKSYSDSLWNDESYVMFTGLDKVEKANEFELNIRKMLSEALRILGKKALILSFDDIDIEASQGWEVLETIRRYFSDGRIISIVSGNQKLYGMIVRNELAKGLTIKNDAVRENMTNELESQYMLKLLRPEKRFNLTSLKSLIQKKIHIEFHLESNQKTVAEAYHGILKDLGIIDTSTLRLFTDFLESMSLRSQINFVKGMWEKTDNVNKALYIFSSRIYAAGIDWNTLTQNVHIINIIILDYLLQSKNLPDYYLLLPTLTDKDMNSNFVAFTFLECENFKSYPYLMFDYLLRIGYLRNVILPINDQTKIGNLISYAGWDQIMSLKNNIGLTIAFLGSKTNDSQKEHISLYGLEIDAKAGEKRSGNSLDVILKKTEHNLTRLMMMFPFVKIAHSENNNSSNFYSIFVLLGIICEILKCETEDEIKVAINDLSLFRTYMVPKEGEVNGDDIENDIDIEIETASINDLAKAMWQWKQAFSQDIIPPYSLGRLATRLYSAVSNVKSNSVADSLNIMICDFFNACVIEEGKVKLTSTEQTSLNNDNPRKEAKVLINNLAKNELIDKLKFSKWIMGCPMLNYYVDKAVFDAISPYITNFLLDKFESGFVHQLLSDVKSKATQANKPDFSGSKTSWEASYKILRAAGYTDDVIQKQIIDKPNQEAKLFIEGTDLFKKVSFNSIQPFKTSFVKSIHKTTDDAIQEDSHPEAVNTSRNIQNDSTDAEDDEILNNDVVEHDYSKMKDKDGRSKKSWKPAKDNNQEDDKK